MKFFSSSVLHPHCQDAPAEKSEDLRRLYVRPQAGICFLDSSPECLCLTSFNGGHNSGGNNGDIEDENPGGGGGHTPGIQDDDIGDTRAFGFRWDE